MDKLLYLHERIRELAKVKNISLTKLAEAIGEKQQTFQQWLKPGSEKNIWTHLPKILELYPDISDVWLYIGRGPIFVDTTVPDVKELKQRIEKQSLEIQSLNQALEEKTFLNDQLTKNNIALFNKCQELEEKLAFLEEGKLIAPLPTDAPGSQAGKNLNMLNDESKKQ